MNADGLSLLIGGLLALGVGLCTYGLLGLLASLRLVRRRSRLLAIPRSRPQPSAILSEDEALGLAEVPWNWLYLAGGLAGLVLAALLGPLVPMLRLFALFIPLGAWITHRYLRKMRRKALAGQVRQLLIDVRMLLTLRGSLLLALQDLASSQSQDSQVMRRLARAFHGGRPHNGLEVLDHLAKELRSPHLGQAVQRIRAAQGGTLDLDRALATTVEDIGEELNAQVEEQLQQTPTRMTFLAVPFLLGPIVILLLYPLADRILQTLAGAYGR
jgi:hypothetical protein